MNNLSSVSIFGFFANWSPFYLVALIFVTVVYFLTVTKWRRDIPGNRPLKRNEVVLFILSMVLLYIVKGSPVDLLSHIIFSFHMLQMAILYLMIVPLLFFAIPSYLIDYGVSRPYIKRVFGAMTNPVFAIIFFNGLFSIYHLPVVLDYLKQSATLHSLFTLLLFVAAVLMWYPVFNRTELPRKQISGLQKLFYIFMIGVLLTPSCGLIIFSQHPMYQTYTDPKAWLSAMTLCVPQGTLDSIMSTTNISGPQYFTNMSPLEDQQTGGVIMKVMQEIFFAVMLFYVFFNWRWSEGRDEEATTQRSLEARQKEQAYFNQFR
ncbi:cytochrome c oxidase assembly factor CtaG [Macrococcus carouselicus]|uniref:Cytochrome c oxidase assembly factor CtaG n=1 Tax=Macrococcus carouselicus TaxID=69969 RepID=A0A9Q8CI59_9STAP|nr:cytochrome c oxidase assembly factor CtaG [Macrococcus carouselicus]TDM03914.1 cytochrome c oxidase assembly factor CtaG [Macrococcus carouselicus]